MGTLNSGTLHREQIGAADAGRTVVEQLALRHGRASLAEWEARAAAGEILLDGQPTAALVRLRAGQCLA